MKIKVTADSTCDLTPALLERFQIRTVPLTIQSGQRTFPDDGSYTSADLYDGYRRDGTLPKTAAVSPDKTPATRCHGRSLCVTDDKSRRSPTASSAASTSDVLRMARPPYQKVSTIDHGHHAKADGKASEVVLRP